MVETFNRKQVAHILNEFHKTLKHDMDDYLDSVEYAMIRRFKGVRITEYCKSVINLIHDAVPDDLDLDYVYVKRYTKGSQDAPDGVRIVVRGETNNIESFEMGETFRSFGDEMAIFYFIAEAYDQIIKLEYALYNLEIASDTINRTLKEENLKYSVHFTASLMPHNLIKDISDTDVTIYCDIEQAIDLGDTVLFTHGINIMGSSDRRKTLFFMNRKLADELAQIKTTPEFIGSGFCVYTFLTKSVKKKDAHDEIIKVYPQSIASFEDKDEGIGYEQTKHTFGYMIKKDGKTSWYLSPYHIKLLTPALEVED